MTTTGSPRPTPHVSPGASRTIPVAARDSGNTSADTGQLPREVVGDHRLGWPERLDPPVMDQRGPVAELLHGPEIVRGEHHGLAVGPDPLERRVALRLEALIPDREHLVEQEDVEVDL